MGEKETPDVMARFQRKSRFDKTEHGTRGHDMGEIIKGSSKLASSPQGPKCHLDGPARGLGSVRSENLGVGSESLKDAARSIPSGAKAPCVDWGKVKRGA